MNIAIVRVAEAKPRVANWRECRHDRKVDQIDRKCRRCQRGGSSSNCVFVARRPWTFPRDAGTEPGQERPAAHAAKPIGLGSAPTRPEKAIRSGNVTCQFWETEKLKPCATTWKVDGSGKGGAYRKADIALESAAPVLRSGSIGEARGHVLRSRQVSGVQPGRRQPGPVLHSHTRHYNDNILNNIF